MGNHHDPWTIIVGAGPSGLLLGLLLAQAGIRVTLLEKDAGPNPQPRATHYQSPAMAVLQRAGVVEAMASEGFYPRSICWRTVDNQRLAGLDQVGVEGDPNRMVCLPLDRLGKILLDALSKEPNAKILWNHEVVSLAQGDNVGTLRVQAPDGEIDLTARYVVGCDGANSKIRRLLFGDWEFPGKTWDVQVVATNAYYDFHKFGYEDANFIIDAEHWHMASRITKDGMWRVSYGVPIHLTREELLEQQPEKWKAMLPGSPTPDQYRITNFSPYKVHQRLAESMRVGSFLLAADAAHLCNPFGGLGLTGGIVDVGDLADCLIGIWRGKADDEILDKYSKVRREKYGQIIDPVSSDNLLRLQSDDPVATVRRDKFFRMIEEAKSDPEKMKALAEGINAIKHDFTQEYRTT